jgi:chemotaxis methyl-accepting protein methylase
LLDENQGEGELFVNSLQISYSEFFRNSLTFSVLEKIIIPAILTDMDKTNRKEIRIWSAACAAGQETYSLAILLNQFRNVKGKKINYRIFATDQSEQQILEAQEGHFKKSALNYVSLKHLNEWFIPEDKYYKVKQELKDSIEFSVFDLLNEKFNYPPTSVFGDFDVVICANLLFYYKPEFRKKIIRKISRSLAPNGYLVTGETEREILLQEHFQEVFPPSAIFKQY